jgi:protein-tyrosine phosphatase
MTDLHTHILPGMDDGAADVQQSLAMLRQQEAQGVKTVALTPHYYPRRESVGAFLKRREAAWQQLQACIAASPENASVPAMRLGAEVSYAPGMWEWAELPQLCYEGTKLLLVELPFTPWDDDLFQELHRILNRRGIMPMIAHLDRYLRVQQPRHLRRLLEMNIPYQVSVSAILRPFSRKEKALWLDGGVPVSDCHDCSRRPPNLGKFQMFVNRKYGSIAAEALVAQTDIWSEM